MQNLLHSFSPQWKEPPPADALVRSASRTWWGGSDRLDGISSGSERYAFEVAKLHGLNSLFDRLRCATLGTKPFPGGVELSYHAVLIRQVAIPVRLQVETTAPRNAHLLIGIGGHSGIEVVLGTDNGVVLWQVQNPAHRIATAHEFMLKSMNIALA